MMSWRVIVSIVVALLIFSVGPTVQLVQPAMALEASWQEWAERHSYKVEAREVTMSLGDGTILVVEFTSPDLQERLGVKSIVITKHTPLQVSSYTGRGIVYTNKPIIRTYTTTIVATSSNDPYEWWNAYPYLPRWTWEKSGDVYVAVDPINLIWGSTKDRVKSVLSSHSWSDYTSYGSPQYIYDPDRGWVEADDMFKGFVFTEQRHVRLWTIYNGFVVGSVHREHWSWFSFDHIVDSYEEPERGMIDVFLGWNREYDFYNLANFKLDSDGKATYIWE